MKRYSLIVALHIIGIAFLSVGVYLLVDAGLWFSALMAFLILLAIAVHLYRLQMMQVRMMRHLAESLRYDDMMLSFRSPYKNRSMEDMVDELSEAMRNFRTRVLERNEMEAWQKLIRVLTHEIMNSITPIISLSETLSEREMSEKNYPVMRQGMQTIHRRSKGLLEFVENYRKLTRLPAPVRRPVAVRELLQDLQSRNERMFLVSFLVLNTADTPRQLGNNIFQAGSIAQKYNCQLTRLDFQQEEGLMSCLPLGLNQIEIQRGLTTSSTAIFVPFTTQELFQNGKEALYYGINALSNNLIMVDRKLLKNPNGLILGTPGSGKSFSAKREIANCFLLTNDDVIICDPEAEYAPLVERLHGQVIKISPTSTNYINPMDLNLDYSDDESPLSLKSDFILSLCELIVGGKDGLQPVQKTIIDRCVRLVYQTYLNDPRPENMPILEDLYNLLRSQEEKEAQYIATALEIYVTGSLNVFNHQSNVDINNRIVCYDIKELGKQLKKIGMLVVQDQVWNRVTINRAAHKSTRYYIDEMHLLLKEEQTAAYTVEIWKRFRKWGGIPTGITQNVKDLLSSREVENIFENSDFVYMLNQAGGDRQILAKQLGISTHQLSYVTHSGEGEGLLFYGSTILPFVDHFPKNTELYRIMTTKPQELKKEDE
jgi:uncharacterized membrane protein (DUF2068 family)